MNDQTLHNELKSLVATEKASTAAVLRHLAEFDARRSFTIFGCTSLFDYCRKELGYDDGQANRRVAASRILRQFPETEEKIASGNLSMSSLAAAQSFFQREKPTREEKKEILHKIEGQSVRVAERTLLAIFPQVAMPEKKRAVTETATELRVTLEKETVEKLESLKSLWKCQSLTEVINRMARETHQRVDPMTKAQRGASPTVKVAPKGRYIPSPIKKAVWIRDRGKCTYPGCQAKAHLELDHVKPFAKGGPSTLDNLRLRCFAHNRPN
jgi:5-methylcytosine-specific restriction endonuclease McrA